MIIPAHNEEKCLGSTLNSVLHPDVEVIVVCNGCTDRTEEIARKFTDKVYVLDNPNVSKARNFGAMKSGADRLIFIDADIVVASGTVDKIVGSHYSVGTCLVKPNVRKLSYVVSMWIKSYAHWLGLCTGLIFCDKNIFERVGGFDEGRVAGEDGNLLRRMRSVGRFGVVNGYVYNDMRRFEKLGVSRVSWFWVKHHLFKGDKKKYEVIR